MSKRLIALIVGALAVGLIAGCGSSSSDSSSSLTKAAFIKRADAICAGHRKPLENEYAALVKKDQNLTGDSAAVALEEFALSSVVPQFQSEAEEIGALGAPDGEENEVSAILAKFEAGIEELKDDGRKIGSHDAPATKEANKLAEEFGLKVCVTRPVG